MHTRLKSLFLILSILVANTAIASERGQVSNPRVQHSILVKHSHQSADRFEGLENMFLKTPLSERSQTNSVFGYRVHPVSGQWKGHQGIDYPAPKGTPIRATAQGKITFIGAQNGYGKVIFISHDNDYSTVYAHQSRFENGLKKGTHIEKGQIIGYVGSTGIATGNHLHYELRANNQPVDPIQEKQQLASYLQR